MLPICGVTAVSLLTYCKLTTEGLQKRSCENTKWQTYKQLYEGANASVSVSWSRSSRGVGKKLRAVVLFTESVTMYVKTWSFLMFGLTNWNRPNLPWITDNLQQAGSPATRHHAKYVCCVITWNGNSFVNVCVLQVTSQDSKAFLSQCLEFCWQDKSGWAPGSI